MKVKNQDGFSPVEWVLMLVIVGILAGTGWYVYKANSNSKDTLNLAAGTNVAVKQKAKKSTTTNSSTNASTAYTVPDSLKSNTADSVKSGNTAALQGYMASSVNVVIAGSEKSGAESAVLAIKDLDYLNSGTDPWNFALDSATLNSYANGAYKSYFGSNTIVGQSANGYVVSFHVNNSGKIDTVFMSSSTDQLM